MTIRGIFRVRKTTRMRPTGKVYPCRALSAQSLHSASISQGISAGLPILIGYDANSNLASDGTRSYVFDLENRMVSMASSSGTVTLRYDPLGRLYEVTDVGGGKRRLYSSGADLIVEYDAGGTMLNRYVHGLGAGDDPGLAPAGSWHPKISFFPERWHGGRI